MATPVRMSATKRGRFPVADKAARTVDGIVFDSQKEAARYAELKLLARAGHVSKLEPQHKMSVYIGGFHFCNFTVDFRYFDERAKKVVFEEVKSSGTAKDPAYRLRRKAAELSSGVKITEVVR